MSCFLARATAAALALSLTACGPWIKHGTAASAAPNVPPSAAPPPEQAVAMSIEDLPEGDSYLANLPLLVSQMGLAPYYAVGQHAQGITVAVLDNGFAGLNHSVGVRLPPGTKVETAPADAMQDTTHGTKLAEMLYALATGLDHYDATVPGPRILLLNTNGFTNFQAAVAAVVAAKVDIVLYAQVWEYGGNFDGSGFINAEVSKATAAGILWVNASGNLGQATYNAPVTLAQAGAKDIVLPYANRYVRFTVPQDQTSVRAVLAWNDFEDSSTYHSVQDLDLIMEDGDHAVVGASRLRQTGIASDAVDPSYSAFAREIVQATLNAGTYYLRVEEISHNFTLASRLRLMVDGNGVRMLDATPDGSLLIPADNPTVVSVGASDVDYSGKSCSAPGGRSKPELQVASAVRFSDGEAHQGTSSASAIVAGTLAVLQAAYGKLDRATVLHLLDAGNVAAASPVGLVSGTCSGQVLLLPDPTKL